MDFMVVDFLFLTRYKIKKLKILKKIMLTIVYYRIQKKAIIKDTVPEDKMQARKDKGQGASLWI